MSELEVNDNGSEHEDMFQCILEFSDANGKSNMAVPIKLDDVQKQSLKNMVKTGNLISDVSTLKFSNGIKINENGVFIPPGLEIELGERHHLRNLATAVKGDKTILVVKVTDAVGKARPETIRTISDDVFGTFGDPVNLKSQMLGCSFGKFNILPATDWSVPNKGHIFNGVMEVTIPVTLQGNSDLTIQNAVTRKVQEVLGLTLPGPFHLVMYILEGCYGNDCAWAAYAYINHWLSVYQRDYYKQVAVQMHEIGVSSFNLYFVAPTEYIIFLENFKPYIILAAQFKFGSLWWT